MSGSRAFARTAGRLSRRTNARRRQGRGCRRSASEAATETVRRRALRSTAMSRGVSFVRTDGLRVRVAINGDGPPLLLIMGLLGNLDLWQPMHRELRGFQTIAFDAPGVGWSDVPILPMSMAGLAQWTDHLLATLGFHRVDVLGLSFGGAVAQQLAICAPARVRRLVLAATSCGLGAVPGSPLALRHLLDPRVLSSRRLLQRASPALFGGRSRRDPSRLTQLPWSRPPSLRGYVWQLAAFNSWSSLPWLHRIRQETLVLAGDDDPLVPLLNARLLAASIRGARLHVVRGGGHLFLLDGADEVAPTITAFLGREHGARADA
jgi:poly(3-hydroxyoctanoate) depolymerase